MKPIRVLYIAGLGRSGSTVVGRILGELPGVVCLGELHRVWQLGGVEDRLCTCARRWSDCALWDSVRAEVPALTNSASSRRVMDWLAANLRLRHAPALLLSGSRWLRGRPDFKSASTAIRLLYEAISAATDADWIVDTSKDPLYGHFLSLMPEIELRVLHMVRDPRAVAHSWRRVRRHPLTGEIGMRIGLAKSAALWTAWNTLTPWIGAGGDQRVPLMRLRYEDFVAQPQRELAEVTEFMGLKPEGLPFVDRNTVRLGENHILSGSYERYDHGLVEVRASEGWRSEMRPHEKVLVTALALPLLGRMGYPLLP